MIIRLCKAFFLLLFVLLVIKCKRTASGPDGSKKKYYRLKQVDKDNNTHYSKIVTNGQ